MLVVESDMCSELEQYKAMMWLIAEELGFAHIKNDSVSYWVSCSDTFAHASDGEDITLEEAHWLYTEIHRNKITIKEPWCVIALFVQNKRGGAKFIPSVQDSIDKFKMSYTHSDVQNKRGN